MATSIDLPCSDDEMSNHENIAKLTGLHGLTHQELQAAAVELCAAGFLTATQGEPGEPGTTYAVAWLPLDRPEQFSERVRRRHASNMAKLNGTKTEEHGGAGDA